MKVKKYATALASLLLTVLTSTAGAANQSGPIDYVSVRERDGLVYFKLKADAPADHPACSTRNYWMVANENSPVGRMQLAALLAAKSSGASVTVIGSGTCTRWPDGENLDELFVRD